jgi:hypothetical protein
MNGFFWLTTAFRPCFLRLLLAVLGCIGWPVALETSLAAWVAFRDWGPVTNCTKYHWLVEESLEGWPGGWVGSSEQYWEWTLDIVEQLRLVSAQIWVYEKPLSIRLKIVSTWVVVSGCIMVK